ncbi:rhodanese-like domain-containing protein [Halovenus marina]|uniref:rhodanese-like domain-containing protein n=1 Tax=Halovenus marina TaxID=3396621 RepID=UPI003F560A15
MDGEIRPPELEATLDTDDQPLVVDIRQPSAFAQGHIPGSVNIPFPRLPQQVDRVEGADHVVTVCPHGEASIRAARLITAFEGFDGTVESLETGITGWEGPLDRDADETEQSSDAPF